MDILEFWERIKRLIKERNTTQELVAAQVGMSFATWQSQMYKNRLPDAFQVTQIAATLGVSVEYLVGAKVPENERGLSEMALTIAGAADKLTDEGKKASLAVIKGLQSIYSREVEMEAFYPDDNSEAKYTASRTDAWVEAYGLQTREESRDNIVFFDLGVIEIPLVGSTAAGKPIDFGDLDPNPPTRPWATPLIKGKRKDYFCVYVKGTSMTGADIMDGDYALLKHAKDAENGEIMLVRHENSSTLKRIKVVEGTTGQEEIFICWEDGSDRVEKLSGDGFEIQGKLVAIERKRPGKTA